MDFLRQIVSGPKNRYRQDGYNLDLTYVTPRIIAMAYPAQGLQKLYRNSIDTVAQLLNKNHQGKYQIINVSGRQINTDKLSNIHSFYWQDHKTPQFQILFIICQIMMQFLMKDKRNVTVVHCNHGKGRTGTLICCFMLFTGYFNSAATAMKYYERQRFEKQGYGVTQPCQIKYIQYFNQILKKSKLFPQVLTLTKIQIKGQHHLNQPYFKLRSVQDNDYLLSTKDQNLDTLEIHKQNNMVIKIRKYAYFVGDSVLEIKHKPVMGKKIAAAYAFNTAFMFSGLKDIQIPLYQLSPLSSVKSGIFQKNFKICLSFKKICNCLDTSQYNKRCNKCQPFLLIEKKKWEIIYQILQRKPNIVGQFLLFGDNMQDNQQNKPKSV